MFICVTSISFHFDNELMDLYNISILRKKYDNLNCLKNKIIN